MSQTVFRVMALGGYLGLWILLPAWYGWLSPSAALPLALVLGFLMLPLAFALPGMLRGKAYTHAWSSLLSLAYFGHGIGEAWTFPSDRPYGLAEVVLSLLWFTGAIFYVRAVKRGRPQ